LKTLHTALTGLMLVLSLTSTPALAQDFCCLGEAQSEPTPAPRSARRATTCDVSTVLKGSARPLPFEQDTFGRYDPLLHGETLNEVHLYTTNRDLLTGASLGPIRIGGGICVEGFGSDAPSHDHYPIAGAVVRLAPGVRFYVFCCLDAF